MKITEDYNIGELVALDYRTAAIFKNHKIDFCCNGNRTITEACKSNGSELEHLLLELNQVTHKAENAEVDFSSWDLDLLADYIEKKHHRYVEKAIPELKAYLHKIASVHGDRHPELLVIEQLFNQSAGELTQHMKKEEFILFPFVRRLALEIEPSQPPFGSVQNPITAMMQEHENEGDRFRKIAELSNDYTPPQDACNTYKVAFAMLKEFEDDLHKHIHLENNILFPGAINAEKLVHYA